MCSNGNPLLSRSQTAGGGSSGTKLSKPFSKPQLKSLKPAELQHVPHLQRTPTDNDNVKLLIRQYETKKAATVHAIQAWTYY